ncbi:flagellin [Porticoccaceae bacterium]|nr:flagellin [Porticoccaceae bacterium]
MTVINTNTAATITANAIAKNERAMTQTMERLSTGQRINSAADDAAGLAISSRMTSQINGLNMAVRNANDAISMVQTEEGAMIEVTNMLQRMRELSVQASTGTLSSTDRTALNTEFSALAAQIQQVGDDTTWNGTLILDGAGVDGEQSFQVGANASQAIGHTFAVIESGSELGTNAAGSPTAADTSGSVTAKYDSVAFDSGTAVTFVTGDTLSFSIDNVFYAAEVTTVSSGQITGVTMHGSSSEITSSHVTIASTTASGNITLAIDSADSAQVRGTTATDGADFTLANVSVNRGLVAATQVMDISTVQGATNAIASMDHAIQKINTARASSGAVVNRLEYAADNLANVSQNTSASRSRILDADYAAETTELARTQIIQQAGTAMLSQANQQAQSVLALLK